MDTAAIDPTTGGRTGGVRLFTRSAITPRWLATAVAPTVRDLHTAGVPLIRMRRGWLGGPHVDVLAAAAPEHGWDTVAAALDAGPEPDDGLTPEAYLEQARTLGRMEAVPPPYLPMRDHGATTVLDADDVALRRSRLNELADVAVVEAQLNTPLLGTIDAVAADPACARTELADAFTALGDTHYLGLGHSAFAFRSHLEAFLGQCRPDQQARVREQFAARLAGEREILRAAVEQRLACTPSPTAAAWRTAFAYGAGTLDRAAVSGELDQAMLDQPLDRHADTAPPPEQPADRFGPGHYPQTDYHRTVAASGAIDTPTPWFTAYRLLINLFYRQLPLLGVSPMQRYYLCFALAETVDEVLGETWQERLDRRRVREVDPA